MQATINSSLQAAVNSSPDTACSPRYAHKALSRELCAHAIRKGQQKRPFQAKTLWEATESSSEIAEHIGPVDCCEEHSKCSLQRAMRAEHLLCNIMLLAEHYEHYVAKQMLCTHGSLTRALCNKGPIGPIGPASTGPIGPVKWTTIVGL